MLQRRSNWQRSTWSQAVAAIAWMSAVLWLVSVTAAAPRSRTAHRGTTPAFSDDVVKFIDARIAQGWEDNEVSPSDLADDAEWMRRVYLDIVGHIPPADEVEHFLQDRDKGKRTKLVDALLDDPAYMRNWTTIWTNLLIGRVTPRRVNREALEKFLREAFAKNRPWDKVVHNLVAAEGHFAENGAVNYLLAQLTMPDEGVQATAKTTRLFMGIQVQCTQCHNHPFNDWKQAQFWQFNSFFRQTMRDRSVKYDSETGRNIEEFSLVAQDFSGPVYFDRRNGEKRVAYPIFFDSEIEADAPGRRTQLADLMIEGDKPWVATAMVNRMWGHLFGQGFTRPVDDMGPHNPPSHPQLLDRLSREFVTSGYDLKLLIRRICHSEAYHLTSRFDRKNAIDDPDAGEMPLFSRVYVKPLQAEQLYDSLITATGAHLTAGSDWSDSEKKRLDWLAQFVTAFGTDENDESTTFNGTIPQALMMMNGELIEAALSGDSGSFLQEVLSQDESDGKKIRRLYLATLSRPPDRAELSLATQLIRSRRDKLVPYQDLFWALLNSNEFILNH